MGRGMGERINCCRVRSNNQLMLVATGVEQRPWEWGLLIAAVQHP